MIQSVAPLALGGVIGWMLYYFVRRFTLFNPRTLVVTLSAIVGGVILQFLGQVTAGREDESLDLWYFLGMGAGFFIYMLYALILIYLYRRGTIRTSSMLQVLLSCGASTQSELLVLQAERDFERSVLLWGYGQISDDLLKETLTECAYPRTAFTRERNNTRLTIPRRILERFETQDLTNLLKRE